MDVLGWFKAATLLALCCCLLCVGAAALRISSAVTDAAGKLGSTLVTTQATLDSLAKVGPQATSTLKTLQETTDAVGKRATASLSVADKVGVVLDKTSDTLDAVNRPCSVLHPVGTTTGEFYQPLKPCGMLADVNRTLATVRGTFGQVEVAARHENRTLTTFDMQEKKLYEDTHASITNLNSLLASPDITRFLRATADTSMQFNAIATDVHREADRITAPQPWYKKIYTYGNTGVNVACLMTHSCPF